MLLRVIFRTVQYYPGSFIFIRKENSQVECVVSEELVLITLLVQEKIDEVIIREEIMGKMKIKKELEHDAVIPEN